MRKFIFFCCLFWFPYLSANYSWTPNVQLSDPTVEANYASVALDSNGNAVAVWRSFILAQPFNLLVIQAATKLFGQPWSAPQIISDSTEPTGPPIVHVDNQGNAIAVWDATIGGISQIRSATKLFNQPWSAPDLVPGSSAQDSFSFVMDGNGHTTIIWQAETAAFVFQILGSERDLLGAWSAMPTVISATATNRAQQLGIDSSGNVTGTWDDNGNIKFARKPVGMPWGAPQTLFGGNISLTPQISVNDAGDAVIVWSSSLGVGTAYIPFNQAALPAQIIPGSSASSSSGPIVGLDNNGNTIAIWFSGSTLQSSTKLFGQPWSFPSIFATQAFGFPVINVNPCNLTLVAFNGNNGVEVSSGTIGSSFSTPFLISAGGRPAIDQNPCGHAMILWEGNDGNPTDIEASEGFTFPGVTSFFGFQRKNSFGSVSEYENRLKWTRAPTQNVSGYRIYRNGIPIATVKAHEDDFTDVRQKKNVPVQYGIAVMESNGAESSPTIITVP